jgi:hypothetical protein
MDVIMGRKELSKKSKPQEKPQEKPKPKAKLKRKEIKETLEFLEDTEKYINNNALNEAINFNGDDFTITCMLLNLLKRHKNDCITLNIENVLIDVIEITEKGNIITALPKKDLFNVIEKCKKKKMFVVIPLGIPKHENMILFNPYTLTFEHYEPHGKEYKGYNKSMNNKIYIKLNNFFSSEKYKYEPPSKTCPLAKGLQEIEQTEKSKGENRAGVYLSDPGGFCVAWSFYLADVRLSNPKLSSSEVYKKALKNTKGNATDMRKFIRSYSRIFLKVLKDVKPLLSKYKYFRKFPKKMDKGTYVNIFFPLRNELIKILSNEFKKHSNVMKV